jgi:AbrB family looped-hinge helix DNA binding protein
MTYKVGAKGQVVLPKELRERHGIRPGDEVVFDDADGEIRIRRAKTKAEILDELVGSLPPSDIDPLEELLAERRRDREREDRKFGPAS